MESNQEANICALCRWNKFEGNNFFCNHFKQDNLKLKESTNYNDSCSLFEEKEERKNLYPSPF